MNIKNTFKLMLSNIKTIFSDLIFRFGFIVVLSVIALTFVTPLFDNIISDPTSSKLIDSIKKIISAFFNGSSEIVLGRQELIVAWSEFLNMLSKYMSEIIGVSIGISILLIVGFFLYGMANYASGVVVNSYMSSLTRVGYFKAILTNFRQGFLYQVINTIVDIIWTFLLILFCNFIFEITVNYISVFSLTLSVMVFTLGKTIFNVFFSNFMPSVVVGKNGIYKALKESFVLGTKNFGSLFAQYIILLLFVVYINISAGIFTLGVGIIFTIPTCCVCVTCVKFVNYYSTNKMKYYVDYNNIIIPAELRSEDEKYLNNIDY